MEKEIEKKEAEKNEEQAHEEYKKSRLDIVAFAKSLFSGFISCAKYHVMWIKDISLNFCNWAKDNPKESISLLLVFVTFILAVGTCKMAYYSGQSVNDNRELIDITRQSANDNRVLVDIARQANARTEKLFVEHIKPVVVATPIRLYRAGVAKDGNKMCTTRWSIVNHSAFPACNVRIDVSYGGVVYIGRWVEAYEDGLEKEKGVITGQYSKSMLNRNLIQKLGEKEGKIVFFNGNLDLDIQVISKGNEGFPVHAEVTWENDRGRVFYETYKYKLTCTKVGEGEHYTFTPENKINNKN
jgi:hypothetical protein